MEVGLLEKCPPEIPLSKMSQVAVAMRAALSGMAVSNEIISTLILVPREDIMYSMQLLQKIFTLFPWETGDSLSGGLPRIAAIETGSQPFYIVVPVQDTYNHSQRPKAFVFHVKNSLLHPQSEFPMRGHCWFISDINASIMTWTYHFFDKLKVIVMDNGHDVLGCC
jgi:hypothetical protein